MSPARAGSRPRWADRLFPLAKLRKRSRQSKHLKLLKFISESEGKPSKQRSYLAFDPRLLEKVVQTNLQFAPKGPLNDMKHITE